MKKKYLYKLYSLMPLNNKGYLFNTSIINNGAVLKKCKVIIKGRNNKIIIEEGCRIENSLFYINGSNNIIHIRKESRFLDSKYWIEKDNNNIIIGERNKSSGRVILAAMEGTDIQIGNDNLMAYNIELRTSDGHSILDANHNRINNAKSIIIGNNNWITKNVTFLKGSVIGDRNVVGFGSLINKEIQKSNCIIVGIPAKVTKENIDWRYEMI